MGQVRPIAQGTRNDDGFTLVELLVVVVIIGILASIAIPVFFNQRLKADQIAAMSDLRNLADFEEVYLTDTHTYGTIAEIQAAEPGLYVSPGVTLSVVRYDGSDGYCLSATHTGLSTTYYYDSQAGGLQPRGATDCQTTTNGVPGDSVHGS